MSTYVLAIDQGTTSTRAIVFDKAGRSVAVAQREHEQIFPAAGWVEHDALEIWANTQAVVGDALASAGLAPSDLAAVGITNQRETVVVWDRRTGKPVHNAIVWQDVRTQVLVDALAENGGYGRYQARVGLPLATYFAGPKIAWILDHVDGARTEAAAGHLLAGTIDTWLIWNLTGGAAGGVHVTDATNASRTLLMDLRSLTWDDEIAGEIGVPVAMLPRIASSSEVYAYGSADGPLPGVPIAAALGDQHAALFGQACFEPGTAKNTYGTGCFMLLNTGEDIVPSRHGLLTTVAYHLGDRPTYALEGSIAVTGSLIQWLRDNLGIVTSASAVESLAASVDDNGGAYFVPAFSGLFAPRWRPDARGALVGLTRYVNRAHIARAALEATAYQTREVVEAMAADSGIALTELKVDGGMTANELLMQFQADQLGVDVVRPVVAETTALGAAYAAGIAVGFYAGVEDVRANWAEERRWCPVMENTERERLFRNWNKAVSKTLDWVDGDV